MPRWVVDQVTIASDFGNTEIFCWGVKWENLFQKDCDQEITLSVILGIITLDNVIFPKG